MTSLRRTTWTLLARPVAGELVRADDGTASVSIGLGADEELLITDPAWARDLATAAAAAASVLESEAGLPAPSVVPDTERLLEERDTYRDLLGRLVAAHGLSELWPTLRDARLALEYWEGQS